MMRWLTCTCALVLLSVAGAPARAQPTAADTATASGATAGPPALRVVVQAADAGLDAYAVQRAIEGELGVVVRGDAHPDVVGTLNVVATSADSLTMEYVGNDGRRNSRTVRLPAAGAKRIETVALVAGNLARDETGQLIEELRPPPPAPVQAGGGAEAGQAPPAPVEAAPRPAPPPAREPRPVSAQRPVTPQKPRAAAEPGADPELEYQVLNLSLFTPIALHSNSPELEIGAELGLVFSDVGRVRGGALSALVSRVRYGFQGARVAGLVNLTSGAARGVSVSGLAALQRGDFEGASIAGAAQYAEGNLTGAEVAGAFAFRKGNVTGVQLSGAFNAAHDVTGVEIGGAVNLARNIAGVQLAGANNTTRSASGLMLAGGLNLATESVAGAQISVVNVAQSINGLQLGLLNVARRVRGLQLGLLNVADEVDGASVGLIPVAGNGYQRFVAWTTPGVASANAAGKFGIGPIYTLLGVGFDQVDGEERFLPTFGVGGQWEYAPIQLSLDGVYQSSHSAAEEDEQEYFLSLRPLVAVRLQSWLRVFGGPALVSGPHYREWDEELKVRAVAGVEVFR